MTEHDPNSKEEKPAALRSAAVKALQSAAREVDPNKSDRLIRYALTLIERARVIRQSRDRGALEGEPASSQREHPTVQTDGFTRLGKLTAELIGKFRPLNARRRFRTDNVPGAARPRGAHPRSSAPAKPHIEERRSDRCRIPLKKIGQQFRKDLKSIPQWHAIALDGLASIVELGFSTTRSDRGQSGLGRRLSAAKHGR